VTTGSNVGFGKVFFVDLQFQRVAEIFKATTAILNNQHGEPGLRPDSLMSPNHLDRANGGLYGIKGFGGLFFGYRKSPLGTDGLLQQLRYIVFHYGTAGGERAKNHMGDYIRGGIAIASDDFTDYWKILMDAVQFDAALVLM
jgi:hypothetical protein